MHLTSVALREFQSYGPEQIVPLDEHLTLIAGRNNAGKSALLRGIWILRETQYGARSDFGVRLSILFNAKELSHVFAEGSLRAQANAINTHPQHTLHVQLVGDGRAEV